MKKLFSLAALFALAVSMHAQTAKNFTLVGSLPYTPQLNDVCAYFDGTTEYAIVGHEDGVSIVSLANPAVPVELQSLPGINTIWREIDVYQDYAYIVNEEDDGMRIIDLSNLPGTVIYKDTIISGMTTGHSLMVSGNRLYVHGSDIDNGGVTVFSLANPWKPSRIGAFTDRYVHDAYYRNNIGYLGEIYDGFLEVVDFTNPNAPVILGTVSTPDQFTHNSWLNDDGTVCYTTDEVDAAVVAAYDITNLGNMTEIDRFCDSHNACQGPPHNVKVLNDYLVTSYYKSGINLVDGDRPDNLIEMGWYDTSPQSGPGFAGAWSSDPYLPSGLVLIGDMEEGLFIVQPNYIRGCYLEGTVTDSATGLTLPGASIVITATNASDIADNLGEYATGVADAGTYTVTYSKFGYVTKTFSLALTNGFLFIKDVALAQIPTISYTINVVESGTLTPVANADVHVLETGLGGTNDYVANAGGIVNDPSFIQGTYDITAGAWGYVTDVVSAVTANGGNTSVTIQLKKGYYDDYYFDFGWTVNTTASSGAWEKGEPVGTTNNNDEYNPDFDINSDFGDECYVTGNGGGAASQDDVDNGITTLTSPIMDMSTYNVAKFKYNWWFANGGGFGGSADDTLLVRISNGITTVTAKRYHTPFFAWEQDSIKISDFITVTANMQIIFVAGDYGNGHLVEAAIDKFTGYDASPTPAAIEENMTAGILLNVFPNPIGSEGNVHYDLGKYANGSFMLTDVFGREIYSLSLNEKQGDFKLNPDLAHGIYFATITVDGEALKTVRVIK